MVRAHGDGRMHVHGQTRQESSYGLYSDGLYSDGLYSDGLYSDGLYSDGLYSYGAWTALTNALEQAHTEVVHRSPVPLQKAVHACTHAHTRGVCASVRVWHCVQGWMWGIAWHKEGNRVGLHSHTPFIYLECACMSMRLESARRPAPQPSAAMS